MLITAHLSPLLPLLGIHLLMVLLHSWLALTITKLLPQRLFPLSFDLEEYSSQVFPDYFIWEYGHFGEGSIVLLGGSSGLVNVLGVCGVG
jgi:hypothetical protein